MGMFKCREIDCFACTDGIHCSALTSKPKSRVCPFFKTVAQQNKESKKALDALVSKGRFDLIDKYYNHNSDDTPAKEVVYVRA